MNREMWDNPATRHATSRSCASDGVTILGPAAGDQACGEVGMGRMLEPDELLDALLAFLAPRLLAGRKVLVTAGPTFEAIDTVRGITNRSSGKMGYAIARSGRVRRARKSSLVSGPTAIAAALRACASCTWTSAAEMVAAVKAHVAGADFFFGVAAVADYTPVAASGAQAQEDPPSRWSSSSSPPRTSSPTSPRCPAARSAWGSPRKARTSRDYAQEKRARKKIPMIVANLVQDAVGGDENEVDDLRRRGCAPRSPGRPSRASRAGS